MAVFKLEIKREFGALKHRVYKTSDAAPTFSGSDNDVAALLDNLNGSLDANKVGKADTVIFRQMGYDSRGDLIDAVRFGKY